ncbi:hypothetical protein VUR80DRAFT_7937 [Thermomyces stellatus]
MEQGGDDMRVLPCEIPDTKYERRHEGRGSVCLRGESGDGFVGKFVCCCLSIIGSPSPHPFTNSFFCESACVSFFFPPEATATKLLEYGVRHGVSIGELGSPPRPSLVPHPTTRTISERSDGHLRQSHERGAAEIIRGGLRHCKMRASVGELKACRLEPPPTTRTPSAGGEVIGGFQGLAGYEVRGVWEA